MPKGMPRKKHPELYGKGKYGKAKSRVAKPRVKRSLTSKDIAKVAVATPPPAGDVYCVRLVVLREYGEDIRWFWNARWCWLPDPLRLQIFTDTAIVLEVAAPFVKSVERVKDEPLPAGLTPTEKQ